MSISAAINIGWFSSDRTKHEYANEIWNLTQLSQPVFNKSEDHFSMEQSEEAAT